MNQFNDKYFNNKIYSVLFIFKAFPVEYFIFRRVRKACLDEIETLVWYQIKEMKKAI